MTLITRQQFQALLENVRIENDRAAQEARRRGRYIDPYPFVKLFTPDGNATWLLTELNPDFESLAFALCDLGLGEPELGYVSLIELAELSGTRGLVVECDLHFAAMGTIAVSAEQAREHPRIVT